MALPGAMPVSAPVVVLIVATNGSLPDHVPPPVSSERRFTLPTQIWVTPDTGNIGSTVMGFVTEQPVGRVYDIFTTPADTPVTIQKPGGVVAKAVLRLLQRR